MTNQDKNPLRISRKQKGGVKFSNCSIIQFVSPCSIMTEDEKKNIWYDNNDLVSFRSNAKEEARDFSLAGESLCYDHSRAEIPNLFLNSLSNPKLDFSVLYTNRSNAKSEKLLKYEEQIRGLEHKIDMERQRNRYISRKAVLEAQKLFKKKASRTNVSYFKYTESLASTSRKFSRWAREIAHHSGVKDEQSAYPLSSNINENGRRTETIDKEKKKIRCQQQSQSSQKRRRTFVQPSIVFAASS